MNRKQRVIGLSWLILIGLMVLILGTGAGVVYAKYLYDQQVGATVTIRGENLEVFLDSDCSQPFTSNISLDFGETWVGEESDEAIYLYAKNNGRGYMYPKMCVQNIATELTVKELEWGTIPTDPEWLDLFTMGELNYTPTGLVGQVGYFDMSATDTSFLSSINTMGSSGLLKIDDEIISYSSIQVEGASDGRWHINGLQRGLYGTVPAAHAHLATVTWITLNNYTPLKALAANEVQPISLKVKASDNIETGQVSFNLVLQATSDH